MTHPVSMADVFDQIEAEGVQAFLAITPAQHEVERQRLQAKRAYEALHTPIETDAERNDPDEYPPEDDE